ncbi:aminotransferase class V-fold PLP-dependent enzyme [Alkaliphilus transvaalensis]|uniref:aminotransferase class V-fold PLP-dependent enzyme n=1 Tax=Alkaliphilus transvaalensis TaxID=114628 RepID=UPI000479C978|nr:aminotransferase class V-fold PLP-dependent enzyme [Alkaliphilus transvaalensis]
MHDRFGPNSWKNLIIGTDTTVPLRNGRLVPAINFDNAATTPPFSTVVQDVINFSPWYSSVHRGTGFKSQFSSHFYENARKIIADFVKADYERDTVIFVKNTTEAINKVAHSLSTPENKQVVLSTCMEHHSNDLPWRRSYEVDYIEIDSKGRLVLEDLAHKLEKHKGSVKLVVVTGASNVTGHRNPIHKIAALAHHYHAKVLVDGAQLVPRYPVDMKPHPSLEHIDYLVFSGHKMYSPFGVGVLVAPKDSFINNPPDLVGGGTVDFVTHDLVQWADLPYREEAGTPNLMGIVALVSAIKTLQKIDLKRIDAYEHNLMEYTLRGLQQIPDIILYGDSSNLHDRVAIIPFNIAGLSHEETAKILSMEGGIAVRNGCFCAQPYIQKLLGVSQEDINEGLKNPDLPRPGMVRVSFGLYNQFQEVDQLIALLRHVVKHKHYYKTLYKTVPDFYPHS